MSDPKQPQYINSIIRATNILELFAKEDTFYLGISEIAKSLNLNKATVFTIVKTLQHQNWLVQTEVNGKYCLSSKLLSLSTNIIPEDNISPSLLSAMRKLRDTFNEDIVLSALVDNIPLCVERVQSSNALRIHSRVGKVANLTKGSTGKTLAAWQNENFINDTLSQIYGTSKHSIVKINEMKYEYSQIRQQGYCISISEQDEGVASVAVPIFDDKGYAKFSLAIIGEENRMRKKGFDVIKDALFQTTRSLHQLLK